MDELIQKLILLTGGNLPVKKVDALWFEAGHSDPCAVAQFMLEQEVRLSTMTGITREDGETDVIYHYAAAGTSINVRVTSQKQHIPSVANILPAANWIEREIKDLYAVQFDGHPDPRRLVRPPETPEGFYRQPGGAAAKKERTAGNAL